MFVWFSCCHSGGFWLVTQVTALLALAVHVCITPSVHAWGMTGHRIVGAIAERELTPQAQQYVRKVLDGAKLQDVSTWADDIRSEETPWSHSIQSWHYISLDAETSAPKGTDSIQNQGNNSWPSDLRQALHYLLSEIKGKVQSHEQEAVLLKLLVHMVADAHQPLHVGNKGDRGGNTCTVYWFRRGGWKTSLHAVWDTRLIDTQKLSYSEWVDYLSSMHAHERVSWKNAGIDDWLQESYALHVDIYPRVDGSDDPFKYCRQDVKLKATEIPVLSYKYQYQVRPILERRLHQAGVRLAALINGIVAQK